MEAILGMLPIFNSALSIIGAFTGNAQAAKASAAVQDAVSVVGALAPLVVQFGDGHEVTLDDVRYALAGKDEHLATFDAAIAAAP